MGRRKISIVAFLIGITCINILIARFIIRPMKVESSVTPFIKPSTPSNSPETHVLLVDDVHPVHHLQEAAGLPKSDLNNLESELDTRSQNKVAEPLPKPTVLVENPYSNNDNFNDMNLEDLDKDSLMKLKNRLDKHKKSLEEKRVRQFLQPADSSQHMQIIPELLTEHEHINDNAYNVQSENVAPNLFERLQQNNNEGVTQEFPNLLNSKGLVPPSTDEINDNDVLKNVNIETLQKMLQNIVKESNTELDGSPVEELQDLIQRLGDKPDVSLVTPLPDGPNENAVIDQLNREEINGGQLPGNKHL